MEHGSTCCGIEVEYLDRLEASRMQMTSADSRAFQWIGRQDAGHTHLWYNKEQIIICQNYGCGN